MFFRKRRDINQMSDEELAARYRESEDPACLGELYERYAHMVYLVCMKYVKDSMESEDLSMQIFEKLMNDLKRYEVSRFRYWLHTVIRHHCLAHIEKRKRLQQRADEFHSSRQAVMESATFIDLEEDGEMREVHIVRLEKAITQLRDEQRVCVELFFLQQKSYQEVAESTGYSMKQVKSYIQNGKRNLQKYLETGAGD